MNTDILPCVEIEPDITARASVIWLHGLGADGHDFEPIVPNLGVDDALGVRFVFPHAPRRAVTLNMGMIMPAWYDIVATDLRRDHDVKGILESAAQIRTLIAREIERGISSSRILLAGFSQGGAIALHVALRETEPLAGILALSTYLVLEESLATDHKQDTSRLPIFQAHGTLDPMVPIDRGESARETLQNLGYTVEWRTYPMGHEVRPDEIRDIGVWVNRTLAARG